MIINYLKAGKVNRVASEELLRYAEAIALGFYGGHFTIFAFTFGVKFAFSTITDRDELDELIEYDDINDAIENAIQDHILTL